mmetsp:Transcript_21345/g.62186  ORF Transcript_21345/g.62186 Transcript_21345/m.62186 type:complete len:245 (-) Transcript_21345:2389-3123(-)
MHRCRPVLRRAGRVDVPGEAQRRQEGEVGGQERVVLGAEPIELLEEPAGYYLDDSPASVAGRFLGVLPFLDGRPELTRALGAYRAELGRQGQDVVHTVGTFGQVDHFRGSGWRMSRVVGAGATPSPVLRPLLPPQFQFLLLVAQPLGPRNGEEPDCAHGVEVPRGELGQYRSTEGEVGGVEAIVAALRRCADAQRGKEGRPREGERLVQHRDLKAVPEGRLDVDAAAVGGAAPVPLRLGRREGE